METGAEFHLVSNYFEVDHDRLDALLGQFSALKRIDFLRAKLFFKDFLRGLKRHIVWEEEVLFPFFESRTGMASTGPTAVMRMEHRAIADALEALHEKVRRADAACDEEEAQLRRILLEHNQKEEKVLYPMIDSFVSVSESAQMFHDMESIPAEKYMNCCGGHH